MNNTVTTLQQAPEWMMYVRALFAFLFVISLIYLSGALARKYGIDKRMSGAKGKEPTLSVIETLYLDPRRKLVRVKAGQKEHLLLLGPTGETLISSQDAQEKQDAA